MKKEIVELITEAYNNDEITAEDAMSYAEFVECADLEDGDDVDLLTEMVDMLGFADTVYESGNKIEKAQKKAEKKEKYRAKLANAKAAISRNKGKILAGAAIATGIASAGYAAGRTGSNRRHAGVIQGLNDELSKKSADYDKVKNAFKQANAQKRDKAHDISTLKNAYVALDNSYDRMRKRARDLNSDNSKLLAKVDALQKDVNSYNMRKRADAYSKALAHAGDSIKNRASVNLDDVNKPSVTQDQLDKLNRKVNASIGRNSKYPERLTTASIAAKSRPIEVTNSRPGSRPGRRPGRR